MDTGKMAEELKELRERSGVKQVFGEPYQVGDKTFIPVAQVTWGGGYGYGEAPESGRPGAEAAPAPGERTRGGGGAGFGGGAWAKPLALIEVSAEGTKVRPIIDQTLVIVGSFLLVAWNVFWVTKTLRTILGPKGARPAR